MSDTTSGDDPTCRSCGDRLSETKTRRVATRIEDGRVAYLHFCSDACFGEWRSSSGP